MMLTALPLLALGAPLLTAAAPVVAKHIPEGECKDARDAMYEAYGEYEFQGDKAAGEKLPKLVESCISACPDLKAECEVYKDAIPEGAPSRECMEAHAAMYKAYDESEFGGDKAAGEKLPKLVEACISACPDQKAKADCELYKDPIPEGECKDARDAMYQAYGEYEFQGDKAAGEKLPKLVESCISACSDLKADCEEFRGVGEP